MLAAMKLSKPEEVLSLVEEAVFKRGEN